MADSADHRLMAAVSQHHRFVELDSLRGVAAMAVVLGHFGQAMYVRPHPVFSGFSYVFGRAHSAVVFFFLLSGFVLTIPFLCGRRVEYLPFLAKRICRIYLPYLAAILIAICFAAHFFQRSHTGVAFIDNTWSEPISLRLIAQHLSMIGSFDTAQFDGVIWTLVIEMRVSLAFPLIIWLTGRAKPLALFVSFVPYTLLLAFGVSRFGHPGVFDTLFYCMMFVTGSILARSYGRIHAALAGRSEYFHLSVFLAGYALCQCSDRLIPFDRMIHSATLSHYVADLLIAAGAVVLMLAATTSKIVRHVLHTRVLLWGGTRSYSIYLLHCIVLFTLIRTRHGQSLTYGLLPVYLCCTLVAAEIFFRLVEVPSMMLGRKLAAIACGTGALRLETSST